MEMLKQYYLGWIHRLGYAQPVFLLLLRLMIGWGFLVSGLGKLEHPANAIHDFTVWGVPVPEYNVYLAATAETVCGFCLMLGFASRIITIPLIGTMVVAYATAHKEVFDGMWADPSGFVVAFNSAGAFPYLVAVLVALLFGPGFLSVDGLLKRFYFDRRAANGAAKAAATTAEPAAPIPYQPSSGPGIQKGRENL